MSDSPNLLENGRLDELTSLIMSGKVPSHEKLLKNYRSTISISYLANFPPLMTQLAGPVVLLVTCLPVSLTLIQFYEFLAHKLDGEVPQIFKVYETAEGPALLLYCAQASFAYKIIHVLKNALGVLRTRNHTIVEDMTQFHWVVKGVSYGFPRPPTNHAQSIDWEDSSTQQLEETPYFELDPLFPVQSEEDCAICFERALSKPSLMVVCGHLFHADCLKEWEGSSCPVCRLQMYPSLVPHCVSCQATESIFVCLKCRQSHCNPQHAFAHYLDSGHPYALDYELFVVYDFGHQDYVRHLNDWEAKGVPARGSHSTEAKSLVRNFHLVLSSELNLQKEAFETHCAQRRQWVESNLELLEAQRQEEEGDTWQTIDQLKAENQSLQDHLQGLLQTKEGLDKCNALLKTKIQTRTCRSDVLRTKKYREAKSSRIAALRRELEDARPWLKSAPH